MPFDYLRNSLLLPFSPQPPPFLSDTCNPLIVDELSSRPLNDAGSGTGVASPQVSAS
jgi:hypothetical protein